MRSRVLPVAVILLPLVLAACAQRDPSGPFGGASAERASQLNTELGAAYLQTGQLQQAHDKLERALEQDPDNASAHLTFAILQARLDKPDLARTHFQRAMRLDPDNPRLHNNYGAFLCREGDYDRGIELFVNAAENRLYERPAAAWANAGACARDANRQTEAREYLQRAIDVDPRTGLAWMELAELELEAGNPGRAAYNIDGYHELGEPTARSLWLAVRIERERGDRRAADEHGRTLVRNFPDSDEAQRFLETR